MTGTHELALALLGWAIGTSLAVLVMEVIVSITHIGGADGFLVGLVLAGILGPMGVGVGAVVGLTLGTDD